MVSRSRNHRSFGIQGVGLLPKSNGEVIYFGSVQHSPAKLGRLTHCNRQYAGRKWVQRAPVPDFGLGIAALAQCSLYRRNGLGRSQFQRRSEEHTSELQSLMRISYAVFCLKKKKQINKHKYNRTTNENKHYT